MSLQLAQPPSTPLSQSELSPVILAIVNNRRITEHSAMIWNIPATQTIYSVVAAFQEACGEIVGVGAMHDMREDPTLKCIRASFATPHSLQIALNLSGTLWGGSRLLAQNGFNLNGKTNSNLLLAQNGFNLNGINNLPSTLTHMSMEDIEQHTSATHAQTRRVSGGINTLVNNGAINAGRGSNKTVAQQIFQHLDMQQLAYLMLVQQHITQSNQFKEQQEREAHGHKQPQKDKDKHESEEEDEDEDEDSEGEDECCDEQTNKKLNSDVKIESKSKKKDEDDDDDKEDGGGGDGSKDGGLRSRDRSRDGKRQSRKSKHNRTREEEEEEEDSEQEDRKRRHSYGSRKHSRSRSHKHSNSRRSKYSCSRSRSRSRSRSSYKSRSRTSKRSRSDSANKY